MLLDENAPTGFWTVDARIDGESAGTYPFEIVSGPLAAPVPHVRIPPSAGEIYHQTEAATVFVEKLGADGKPIIAPQDFSSVPIAY